MRRAALAGLLWAGACQTAAAEPAVPATLPATALEDFPHVAISNGLITAQVYPPGKRELNQGTRFDHAGVVFHVTYKGQDYSTYWFDHFVVDPRDETKYPPGTEHACCSMSGPVEEFAPVGFDDAGMNGRFLKPGIGIFQRINDRHDQFPTLPVLNAGARSFKATKTGARWTQDVKDAQSGFGYHYIKSVQLVPGKPQMTISHVLTNTGKKPIVTTGYNHNFLTLSPGNEHVAITAPFAMTAEKPLQPELAKLDGKAIRYLAALPAGVTVTSPIGGFGTAASDYDFTVTNTQTGFGQRIRADQPIARINFWSIKATLGWEPYIAIDLKPGQTKRWTYTYDFFGPDDKNRGDKP
ncbi:MAG TPA: hypothetical protein VGG66_10440 [Rhizomicrobium sp.]